MIARFLKKIIFRIKWRKLNKHNYTYAKNVFLIDNVIIGKGTYGGINVLNNLPNVKLRIGNYCSIAEEVIFILGADHQLDNISTYPFKYRYLENIPYEAVSKGDIVLDDDIWVGYRAMIMSGVHIHQGAVIAAGAVVTKDVPAYAIVGGVPAKIIGYRFDREIIERLKSVSFSKLDEKKIINNIDTLYTPIRLDNFKNVINSIDIE